MIASFLDGATQAHHALLNATISAGKLSGLFNSPSVELEGTRVDIGPCSGLFGCGVFFKEDNISNVVVTGLGQDSTVKTIAWEIDPQLYAQPSLVVLDGNKQPNWDPYHVVVAWVFYPGGNLTLTNGMLVGVPSASVPRNMGFFSGSDVFKKLSDSAAGPDASLSFSEGWTSISNASSIVRTWRVEYELQSDSAPISCISFDAQLSSQTAVRLYFKRYGQPEVLVIDGTLTGPFNSATWQVPLLRHRVQPWERFSIYMDVTIGVGASSKFGALVASNESIVSPQTRS